MSSAIEQAFVLGAGGFIGRRILSEVGLRYSPLLVSQVRDENDLPRFEREVDHLLQHNPQVAIVNCIGIRAASLDIMTVLNTGIPEILAIVAERHEARLIHFGSAAETIQLAQKESLGVGAPPAAMLTYGMTKGAGTEACLAYENATVLRVYNLHGLPHQSSSGLHQLCRSVRIALDRGTQPALIDTTRDYVHWQTVLNALNKALDLNSNGLIEVCSGFGIAMSEIIEGLPLDVRTQVAEQLKPPDYFAPVIGPHPSLGVEGSNKSTVVRALRDEVMTCASSG
jgi:nucleoside-diphosphate-sugar epimerase